MNASSKRHRGILLGGVMSLAAATVLLMAPSAFAQRGESYSDNNAPTTGPSTGVPGFFDTYMAEKGRFVLELPPVVGFYPMPTSTLDYGLTDDLTVGTNTVVTTLPYLASGYGGAIKLRSLIHGSPGAQSTLTYYGAYMQAEQGGKLNSASYNVLTSNTTLMLGERNLLTGSLIYLSMAVRVESTSNPALYESISGWLGMIGVSYERVLTSKISIAANTTLPVLNGLSQDSTAGSATLSVNPDSMTTLMLARAYADFRVNERWTLSIGLLAAPAAGTVLPWLSAVRRY